MGKQVRYIITFNRYGRRGEGRSVVGSQRITSERIGKGKYRLGYKIGYFKTYATKAGAERAMKRLFPKSWGPRWNPRIKKIKI